MNKIFLIEDHDQALKIWRENNFQGVDLVHLDAHIDFGIQKAEPIERIIKEAGSLKELKANLEYSLAFKHYESDFDKQTNIGNYIYPAMKEGIVDNFYWVIPGGLKEFRKSKKLINRILKDIIQRTQSGKQAKPPTLQVKDGLVKIKLLKRNFMICILEKLPILRQRVLIDVDVDFLVVDSLINADSTVKIGKRFPWIYPDKLVSILKRKIKNPEIITIAYSVNGGFTPMKYKCLGDELAYYFSPHHFKERFKQSFKANEYFNLFNLIGEKQYYQRAVCLDSSYRVADNNYGFLYLARRKFYLAKKEFLKILKVDPKNPACLLGLGNIALERKDFEKAKTCFLLALKAEKSKLFTEIENKTLFGLAKAEFELKNFKQAEQLFCRYQRLRPLEPQSYYFLGNIFKKKKDFKRAAKYYQDALKLGLNDINVLYKLLKITHYFKEKRDTINFVVMRFNQFKEYFNNSQRVKLNLKSQNKKIKSIKHKIQIIEKMLFAFKEKEE